MAPPRIRLTWLETEIWGRLPGYIDNFVGGYMEGLKGVADQTPAAIARLIAKGVARPHDDDPGVLVMVPGVDLTYDQRHWRVAEGEPGPDPLTAVDLMAAGLGVPLQIPRGLLSGRVRACPEGGWIAETGSGETLRALPGRHESAEAAALAASDELARRIEAFAALLEREWSTTSGDPALPCPLGLMARHVRTIRPLVATPA